jgi:hypothetical protein
MLEMRYFSESLNFCRTISRHQVVLHVQRRPCSFDYHDYHIHPHVCNSHANEFTHIYQVRLQCKRRRKLGGEGGRRKHGFRFALHRVDRCHLGYRLGTPSLGEGSFL